MAKGSICEINGVEMVTTQIFDGAIHTMAEVWYVLKIVHINLISFVAIDSKGFGYSMRGEVLNSSYQKKEGSKDNLWHYDTDEG